MSKISVIISSYQHEKTIAKTIDSILAQTRLADEIIIVDDGSIDNTIEKINLYKDRVKYYHQKNSGAPVARNSGFDYSNGDYVLFCDADVIMKPNMLERLESVLVAHPSASYAYCRFRWGLKGFSCRSFDTEALKKRNFIHTSAALIRREHFARFDETLVKFQDWDLWLTMLEQGHVGVFVDEELYVVRQDHGRFNMSSWLPKFMYTVPWDVFHWKPNKIQRYEDASLVIKEKHGIE